MYMLWQTIYYLYVIYLHRLHSIQIMKNWAIMYVNISSQSAIEIKFLEKNIFNRKKNIIRENYLTTTKTDKGML